MWLPSGGSLVIDTTEAMTVIDVNTGKFTGQGGNLEQTVTRNNLEAAEEIVRQLRVRDVGGIIVIDFIDMVLESNRDLVLRRLLECLARDRTKHQVAEVTSLGLVQMTRKRVGSGLLEAFSVTCDCCNGRGVLVSLEPVDHVPAGGERRAARRPGRRPPRAAVRRARGRGSGGGGGGHAADADSSQAAKHEKADGKAQDDGSREPTVRRSAAAATARSRTRQGVGRPHGAAGRARGPDRRGRADPPMPSARTRLVETPQLARRRARPDDAAADAQPSADAQPPAEAARTAEAQPLPDASARAEASPPRRRRRSALATAQRHGGVQPGCEPAGGDAGTGGAFPGDARPADDAQPNGAVMPDPGPARGRGDRPGRDRFRRRMGGSASGGMTARTV